MHTSVILKTKSVKDIVPKEFPQCNGHKTFNISFYSIIFTMEFYFSKAFEQYLPVFHIFIHISFNNGLRAIAWLGYQVSRWVTHCVKFKQNVSRSDNTLTRPMLEVTLKETK